MKLTELDDYHRKKRWEKWEKEYLDNLEESDKKRNEEIRNSKNGCLMLSPWERDKFGLRYQEIKLHCQINELIYQDSWASAVKST